MLTNDRFAYTGGVIFVEEYKSQRFSFCSVVQSSITQLL
jgi:hypothetical protein